MKELPFSDFKVFNQLLKQIPEDYLVQMGNSSVVRYIQLFNPRPDLKYFGNRGTSGIDGCTSTAVGATLISQKPTLLVTGDIAFFYDSNAFWHQYRTPMLKTIVINNGGGGIFRIIGGPKTTGHALDDCFETPHHRTAKHIAEDYQLQYISAANEEELSTGLQTLFGSREGAILEVFTSRELNDKVLKDYFEKLKS
ncbi:MAG: hypothetical protein HRT74_07095 [Flavobacteriales bacterium]|nr:hypothetical protein [Flavobacteriales bacterium]